jgi:2,4-dienoyl-CoA reductase-like NADH-dependent reductase (Old Yellow Enzyme family)
MTSTVGMITEPEQAEELVASGKADAVMMARAFLRNPRWPLHSAAVLGQEVKWPLPIARGKI